MGGWIAALGGIANAGMGLLLEKHQDKRQVNQQKRLTDIQVDGSKDLTAYNYKKQMEMWNNTNYGAQMAHIKEAGLNPGLMYGMSGGGGVTTGGGGGSVGGGSASSESQIPQVVGMGIQMQLMEAQKRVLETQADKNEAEANKTKGVDTEEGITRIKSLTQGISNQKAVEGLTNIQAEIGKIDKYIKNRSKEASIDIIRWESEKVWEEARILHRKNLIDDQTMTEKVDIVKTELAGMILENALIKAKTKTEEGMPKMQESERAVNTQQIATMKQQIESMIRQGVQKWKEIEVMQQGANSMQSKTEQENWVNDVSKSLSLPIDIVEAVAQAVIFRNIISPKVEHKPVQGFKR